ncbi:MAG: acyl-CoA thioesterase [Deltaproteobacteria bacterium]|nr:acyl-CoA thioesterase [Deltaproteobacteria bacterium]
MAYLDAIDPSKATTRMPLRVRFCETDLMGIVHHSSYFLYFEAGRVEWLRRRGVTYAEWAAKGIHLPVVDTQATYKMPARFDDLLTIETSLTKLGTVSIAFAYKVLRDEALLAEGATRLGCVDASHKLSRMTDEMRAVLLGGEI